jgi:hypothetical protein
MIGIANFDPRWSKSLDLIVRSYGGLVYQLSCKSSVGRLIARGNSFMSRKFR